MPLCNMASAMAAPHLIFPRCSVPDLRLVSLPIIASSFSPFSRLFFARTVREILRASPHADLGVTSGAAVAAVVASLGSCGAGARGVPLCSTAIFARARNGIAHRSLVLPKVVQIRRFWAVPWCRLANVAAELLDFTHGKDGLYIFVQV